MEGEQKIVMKTEEEADGLQKTIDELKKELKEVEAQLDAEANRAKALEQAKKEMNFPKWLEDPEELSYEEAKQKLALLTDLHRKIMDVCEKNTIGASSSQKEDELSPSMEGHKDGDADA